MICARSCNYNSADLVEEMSVLLFLIVLLYQSTLNYSQINHINVVCNATSVRLVNGETNSQGRVEMCYNGQWATICDETFEIFDGKVVCSQLGLPNSVVLVYDNSAYGSGTGEILSLSSVTNCVGNEVNIFDCRMFISDDSTCSDHTNDVGLSCHNASLGNCIEGSVQLTGGDDQDEGRIEVCYNGEWGNVCDTTFGLFDGQVVCGQVLGVKMSMAEIFYDQSRFNANALGYWIEEIHCVGDEDNILDCSRSISNCKGGRVGIQCRENTGLNTCDDGEIRLVDFSDNMIDNEGRLEVCYNGDWGAVCASSLQFGRKSASVVCNQLGFSSNGTDVVLTGVDPGSNKVQMRSVDCCGNETSLFQCNSVLEAKTGCTNNRVGIRCTNATGVCSTGSIRLADGNMGNEGRLEVCFIDQWGTVCSDNFNSEDVMVACKQLGYTSDYTEIVSITNFGQGDSISKIWLANLFCFGREVNLFDCPRGNNIGITSCSHDEDAAIRCFDNIVFDEEASSETEVVLGPGDIQTSINITCTVDVNTVTLDWTWKFGNTVISNGDHYDVIVDDSTRSTTLSINNITHLDSGGYCCSASYAGTPVNMTSQNQTKELTLIEELSTTSENISFTSETTSVSLICELTGYLSTSVINWRRNGNQIVSIPAKYEITDLEGDTFNSINFESVLRRSIVSRLTISNLVEDDSGVYQCSSFQNTLNIDLEFSNLSSSSATTTTTVSSDSIISTTATSSSSILQSPTMDTSSSLDLTTGYIAAAVMIAVIIIVTMVLTVLCTAAFFRKKQAYSKKKHGFQNSCNIDACTTNTNTDQTDRYIELENRYSNNKDAKRKVSAILQEFLIEPVDLKLLEKIGQGEFGIVYRGLLTEWDKKKTEPTVGSVAVKTLRGNYSDTQIDQLLEEAQKMKTFDHLNVLTLIGVSLGVQESPCIVMPFMSNGSLLSYLRKEAADLTISELADETIVLDTTKQLLSMCLQVAKGMAYLTEQKFVHRDLAARNCMISSDFVIKVADFGLAEDIYTTEYFKQSKDSDEPVKLPIKWMASESIHFGKFSEKTDVWSYGILCWEIFTLGRSPYPGIDPRGLVHMLDNGERLDRPSNPACTEEMYTLMSSCWRKSPNQRPPFTDIVDHIEKLMAPLADYMDFTTFSVTINK